MNTGPELSNLGEKYPGRVAIVGVNNESMFRPVETENSVVKDFLEEHKADFRYTIYIDTKEGHALESKSPFACKKKGVENLLSRRTQGQKTGIEQENKGEVIKIRNARRYQHIILTREGLFFFLWI